MHDVDWAQPIDWGHPLNRGLVSWWLASPYTGFGSTRWRDMVQRSQAHGTLTNMDPKSDWVGPFRTGGWGGLDFDGSNDYAVVPHSTDLNLTESAATIIWSMRAPHAQGSFTAFLDKGAGDALGQHTWAIRPPGSADDGAIVVTVEDNQVTFAAGSYPDNVACRMAVTWDGTNVRLHRDGVHLETLAQPVGTYNSDRTDTLKIGAFEANSSIFLPARATLDSIRLHNVVFSEAQLRTEYHESLRGYPGLLNRVHLPRYAPEGGGGGVTLPAGGLSSIESVYGATIGQVTIQGF